MMLGHHGKGSTLPGAKTPRRTDPADYPDGH